MVIFLSICPLFSICRLPLYKALFTSFRRCQTERKVPVLLPGVMMKGQAQVQITLHHHVCVHLCASVAALSPVYLPMLVGAHQYTSKIRTLLLCLFLAVVEQVVKLISLAYLMQSVVLNNMSKLPLVRCSTSVLISCCSKLLTVVFFCFFLPLSSHTN